MPEAPPQTPKSRGSAAIGAGVSHSARTVEDPSAIAPRRSLSSAADAEAALRSQRERMEQILRDDPEFAFHVGTLPECPRWNLDLAGVNFPRSTERVELRGGETIRTPMAGAVVRISETKHKDVLRAIANRVVRFRKTAFEQNTPGASDDLVGGAKLPDDAPAPSATSVTGTVIVMDGNPQRPYRPQRGDRPLADFVYMERRPDLDAAKPSYPKPLSAAPPTE